LLGCLANQNMPTIIGKPCLSKVSNRNWDRGRDPSTQNSPYDYWKW
jgi:hypothetical protein